MIGDNIKEFRKKKERYRRNMSTFRHTHTLSAITNKLKRSELWKK